MSIRELDTVPLCVTLTLRYCYTGQPEELAEGESGIAEEVVDAEQFWKGTGFGVFSLGFEDRIAEPGMATAYKLFQKSLVVAVGWAIEAQPALGEKAAIAPLSRAFTSSSARESRYGKWKNP